MAGDEPKRDEPAPPRRRLRRTLRLALVALVSFTLLAGGALLLLQLDSVQRAIVDRALRAVEKRYGLNVDVDGFALDLLHGRARASGVTVSLRGARPFLEIPDAAIDVDLRAALDGRLVVTSVEATGVVVDLGAPLPSASRGGAPGPAGALVPDVEIERFRIAVDSLLSGPLPPSLQPVLLSARAESTVLEGSVRRGRVRLLLEAPSVVVDRRGPVRLAVALKARAELENPDRLVVSALGVEGEGISLSAELAASLARKGPLQGKLDLAVDPDVLVPEAGAEGRVAVDVKVAGTLDEPRATGRVRAAELTFPWGALEDVAVEVSASSAGVSFPSLGARLQTGGRLSGVATVSLPERTSALSLRGEGVDVAVAAPFLPAGALERWGVAGTRLDFDAGVKVPSGDVSFLTADALVVARRAALVLAQGDAHLTGGVRAVATLGLDLLPASPGRRSVTARVEAPDLAGLSRGRLVEAQATVNVPDLGRAWVDLSEQLPGVVPAPVAGPDLGGPLALTARASGPLLQPDAEAEARWEPTPTASVTASAAWAARRSTLEAVVGAEALPLERLVPGASGVVWVAGRASGPAGALSGALEVDAAGLCPDAAAPLIDALHLEAGLSRGELTFPALALRLGDARVAAVGRVLAAAPLRDADLSLRAGTPGLVAEGSATLRDSVLEVDLPKVGVAAAPAALLATVPLGAFRSLDLPRALASRLPAQAPDGVVTLHAAVPDVTSCDVEAALGGPGSLPPVRGGLALAVSVDPRAPAGAWAHLRASRLSLLDGEDRVEADGDVSLLLKGGRLELPRVGLTGRGTRLSLAGGVEVDLERLVSERTAAALGPLAVSVDGEAEAALLDPFLAGGSATGKLALAASAEGRLDALRGTVDVRGPGASFLWPVPYATQIADPELSFDVATRTLTRGLLRWNGGRVSLSGGLAPGKGLDVVAELEGVRYRLAYGLTATLGGILELEQGPGGDRKLSGTVSLERGVLTQDIDLDRELLTRLLAPPPAEGTETSFRDTLALDVDLETESGVRVRNNLADLRATWSTLSVTGTARSPVVKGRIDVERGGLVFAYGQAFRVDRGTITYTGDAATDPRLDFVTTSSLQDPTVGRSEDLTASLGASRGAAAEAADRPVDAGAELARGLAGYYGERLASQLNQALGIVRVSLRPLLLFGETDPGTQLTVSRDVSRFVTLAFAVDLKNAQRQTYLLDVHGLRGLPPVSAQVFTSDDGSYGGTLQQRIELGGSRVRRESPAPLVASVDVDPPAGVSRRRLLRAVRLVKGDAAEPGLLFDAEVDLEAALRELGFPNARATVAAVPSARKPGRVDVRLAVEPGPRAEVRFVGDQPPSALRREIRDLYRAGALEPSTLEEMRRATVRAFRTLGHVEPEVEVAAADLADRRRVTVRAEAGPRAAMAALELPGLPDAEAASVASRLASPLARAELAAGVASADARLLGILASLGYPEARLVSRELSADGRTLTVGVEPGRPSLVDSVTFEGLSADEVERLRPLVPVEEGEPARAPRIAEGAVLVEEALQQRGFARASVRTVLAPASPEVPPRLAVTYRVDPGAPQQLGDVRFEGLRSSSPRMLGRVAGLTPGEPFRRSDVDEARGRLFGLGLFSGVRTETGPGKAPGLVDVTFVTEEAPRFSIAYGFRWENDYGTGVVVDVVDRNVLGQGVTFGVRGLYDPNDRKVRLYLAVPGVLASKVSLEAFVGAGRELREKEFGTRVTDTQEATLQLSRPLGGALTGRLYGRYSLSEIYEPGWDPDFPFEVTVKLPYLGAQLLYDTREDPVLGTRGLFASVDLQASGSFLGSDYAFGRLYAQVNHFLPVARLSAGPVVWAQSVRAGFAKGFEGQEVIPDVRFLAGGSYSVRGYATDELGPREQLGDESYAVGGNALFVLNEELRVPLHPRLTGIAFLDVGQVWASPRDFLTGLAPSVGLGLRAVTPMGVLRLDAAYPLRPKEWDPRLKLYFGFGNVF